MTPSNGTGTREVNKTVFDLTSFDDVQLVKTVQLPARPTSVQEALAAVGNNTEALLAVIYDGLVERVVSEARADMSGFKVENEDGELVTYDGKYADGEKSKKINAAILALAKMQGFDKSLSKDAKRALKEKATEFLRSSPAMLASIQG